MSQQTIKSRAVCAVLDRDLGNLQQSGLCHNYYHYKESSNI